MKNFITTSLVVFAAFYYDTTYGAEFNVLFHSISNHSGSKYTQQEWSDEQQAKQSDPYKNYNETNRTIGAEYISGKHGVTAVMYDDSFHTTARYVAGVYLPFKYRYADIGLMYGIIKGDSYEDGRILPLITPYVTIKTDLLGANVIYSPKTKSNGNHVLGIQFKVRFKQWSQ